MNRKKMLISAGIVAAALAIYALLGFYLVPYIAVNKLPVVLQQKTGQQTQLKSVRLNPFSFILELEGFALSSAADGKNLLGFERLVIDLDVIESAKLGGMVLEGIELLKPQFNIERRADGMFNFAELLAKPAEPEPEAQDNGGDSLALLIHQVAIKEGRIGWQDAATGQVLSENLLPLNLTFSELSTQAASNAVGELNVGLESGGTIEWRGDFTIAPLASKGHLTLANISLARGWQLFLQQILPMQIVDGRLGLQVDYALSEAPDGLLTTVSNGNVDIKQLEITEKNQGKRLLSVPALAIGGINVDVNQQQVGIASLSSSDAVIKAWLQADGVLNYQALFAGDSPAPAAAQTASAPPATVVKPWLIKLDELALNNYAIDFTDLTLKKPVELQLSELNCKLQKFDNQENGKLPVQFSSRFNRSGSLKIDGEMSLEPFAAIAALDIKSVNLKVFQPYLDQYLKLDLVDGDFNGKGNLQLAAADQLQLTFQGEANLDGLITRDQAKNKDFLKWANLALIGVDIDLAKQDFKIGKVMFDRPYLRFNIKKDGKTNVDDIMVSQKPAKTVATAKSVPKPESGKSGESRVSIGKIELKDGKSDFADYSLILPFVAEMNSLNGDVSGFSSDKDAEAKLVLKGKVYDMATVGIKGKYQFDNGDSDITLNFANMPLPLITPYMAEFAGYKIEKGQMTLDLQYKIKHRQLEVRNKLFIDQLTLGEHIENPNAVSLPLHLAIALLKDTDGKINLDFPITGSLEDPKFSIGSLIADVLVNLVAKVATSPFKAIASLLGDDTDFSTVSFAPGSAELVAEETAKLDQLKKALDSKPELTLEVKGIAYQNLDWPAMRLEAVKDVLKKMKSGELLDKGQKVRHEYIELSDDDYKRLLAKFFGEVFPQDMDRSLLGRPRIKNDPNADFYTVARQKLEGVFPPDPQRLNDLAVARANHIAQYLTEPGGISKDRVYILATELSQAETADGITSVLSLNASQ
ncbi:DUF748 domain-containing protein [Methylomonas montana]|uniref:DUF748 domain-containing protein n=1 Tax=Methylomonas montana TaxID=3058963 RepID=UPI00265B5C11|nr:DUF748 domain-containing protein [Methylomonas montana]WKJ92043.1 DUF748 domain-containing protein [Methylomonas montana]